MSIPPDKNHQSSAKVMEAEMSNFQKACNQIYEF